MLHYPHPTHTEKLSNAFAKVEFVVCSRLQYYSFAAKNEPEANFRDTFCKDVLRKNSTWWNAEYHAIKLHEAAINDKLFIENYIVASISSI